MMTFFVQRNIKNQSFYVNMTKTSEMSKMSKKFRKLEFSANMTNMLKNLKRNMSKFKFLYKKYQRC